MKDVDIVNMYWDLIRERAWQLPTDELRVVSKLSAEEIAVLHFRGIDWDVCRNHKSGEWSETDKAALKRLSKRRDYLRLKEAYDNPDLLPTLLLTRDDTEIRFVEVIESSESVGADVVEFYIRYGNTWPVSVLEVVRKGVLI